VKPPLENLDLDHTITPHTYIYTHPSTHTRITATCASRHSSSEKRRKKTAKNSFFRQRLQVIEAVALVRPSTVFCVE